MLRKEKGVKRFYVFKNLEIMEKLSESKDKIYDPVLGREVKITDIDRALEYMRVLLGIKEKGWKKVRTNKA